MKETMIQTEVTYTLEHGGRFYLIEHVPARVCRETGEQYFAPETVEHIQALIKGQMLCKKFQSLDKCQWIEDETDKGRTLGVDNHASPQ